MSTDASAAIYARYSSRLQRETSIDDQVRVCREFAAQYGFEVADEHVFADSAISGTVDESGRPQLAALVSQIKARQIRILFVDELSRLHRDLIHQQIFLKTSRACGTRVIDRQGFDSENKGAKFMSAIRGAMDEHFIEELRDRQRRGIDGALLNGYFRGRVPYGLRAVYVVPEPGKKPRTRWELDSSTATIVRRIFDLRYRGFTYATIAETLSADGVPAPGGKQWNTSAIQQILRRPIYAGIYRFRTGTADEIEIEHPELAMIDYTLFRACQGTAQVISTSGRSGAKLWASGLVHCSCGHSMTASRHSTQAKTGRIFCKYCYERERIQHHSMGSSAVDLSVLRDVLRALLGEGLLADLIDQFKRALEERRSAGPEQALREVKQRIARLDASLERLAKLAAACEGCDIEHVSKQTAKQADALRVARVELARLESLEENFAADAITPQMAAELPLLVERLFDESVIQPGELRANLHRIFPEIIFEGRENRRISFWSARFAPGVALALATGTRTVDSNAVRLSLRVFSPCGSHGTTRVEVLPRGVGYRFAGPGEKRCTRCGILRETRDFSRGKSYRDGLNPYCRTCASQLWSRYASSS